MTGLDDAAINERIIDLLRRGLVTVERGDDYVVNGRRLIETKITWIGPDDVFVCPRCWSTSHKPHDLREGYCGNCHWWTGDPDLGPVDLDTAI